MVAVVTGASSGIGKEMARALAKRGFDVILVARREERLLNLQREIKKRYKVNAEVFVCDLKKTKECYKLFEYCKNKPVKIFVNNAGVGHPDYVTRMNLSKDSEMIKTNLVAVHLLTKLFARHMKRGIILNVSSMAGFQPGPGMAVYGATKSYIYQFSRAMGYELKRQKSKVRIAILCPGPVDTEFDNGVNKFKFRVLFRQSAKECAEYAVSEMLKGKEVIIPGFTNRLLRQTAKFIPENIVLCLEHKIQTSKHQHRKS
ncbi:SDR family NAD(P)-dependent oxidoreductase [Clostridium sp. Marseille-P299]|uniref:SDR family NAD(P)-dependent oxidoreductase n=1 Tax=Clostridium sp. Marseille-P299 TaxID=1805477 RepID=UPI00082F9FD7|nr:SDR family oxidoreductase [Clostridium sp. Marseille-P299]